MLNNGGGERALVASIHGQGMRTKLDLHEAGPFASRLVGTLSPNVTAAGAALSQTI